MNRRGFLGRITLALAAVAIAPAIELLAQPETPCSGGLLWQIENSGQTIEYTGEITMTDFNNLIKALDTPEPVQQPVMFFSRTSMRNFNHLLKPVEILPYGPLRRVHSPAAVDKRYIDQRGQVFDMTLLDKKAIWRFCYHTMPE